MQEMQANIVYSLVLDDTHVIASRLTNGQWRHRLSCIEYFILHDYIIWYFMILVWWTNPISMVLIRFIDNYYGIWVCSWATGVYGFWCHRLERTASPCRNCAVTCRFQTTTQDLSVFPFLPRHYHMTHITNHQYCLEPVVLAIINII